MLHKMTLDPSPFDMIACGKKDIELRLYDEKRRQLKTGDEIQFSCKERRRVLLTVVAAINVYKDFRQLYNSEPLKRCGYGVEQLNSASLPICNGITVKIKYKNMALWQSA